MDRIDESRRINLAGNTHPAARAEFDRGMVAPSLRMDSLQLVLKRSPEQQAALDRMLAGQLDPASTNYHRWLTPEEFGALYGPSQADIDTLTDWLRGHGLTVEQVSPGRTYIQFGGSAAQVESAFHVEIHNLDVRMANGAVERHIANMSDPQVPAAFANILAGLGPLHNFFSTPQHVAKGMAHYSPSGSSLGWSWRSAARASEPLSPARLVPKAHLQPPADADAAHKPAPDFGITDVFGNDLEMVGPYDFAAIYNVLPLWTASTAIDGTGQTIAIAGRSNISPTDVKSFRSFFGLPTGATANVPQVIVTNTDPGTGSADDLLENSLDVEWSGAVAKGATIVLVTSSSTATTGGDLLSEEYVVNHKTASILSESYGECELYLGISGNQAYKLLWEQAQAEGIAVFAAAGDQGSAGCDDFDSDTDSYPFAARDGYQVNGIASTPYDVAVGGTDLNWMSDQAGYWSATNNATTHAGALGYIPEFPWNDSCVNPYVIAAVFAGNTAEATCNAAAGSGNDAELVTVSGGGGGVSGCTSSAVDRPATCAAGYAKPSWQSGVSGIPADGKRDIPDVSLFAADGLFGSAYPVCDSAATPDGTCDFSNTTDIDYLAVGGTSVAAPAMAGIMALIDQKLGTPQGNPNATLYKLAGSAGYSACGAESATASSCVFHDVDSGTIAMPCATGSRNCVTSAVGDPIGVLPGYAAGAGYDLATGLGSVNVGNLVAAWPVPVVLPTVEASPASLAFAGTTVGTTDSARQTATLTNTGTVALTIKSITLGGTDPTSFSETTTCPSSLAAKASCAIVVAFSPKSAGSLAAQLTLADNAANSPQTVALSGTGVVPAPVVSLSSGSLSFPATATGSQSPAQLVTLLNIGNASLALSKIQFTGANPTSFRQLNDCAASIAASSSCSFLVYAAPAAAGNLSAVLALSNNAAASPQTVAVSTTGGAAPAVTLSEASLSFGAVASGTVSVGRAVTLSNTGNTTLYVSGIALAGSAPGSFVEADTCGAQVAPGANCLMIVEFAPTAKKALAATLIVTANNPSKTYTIPLSGTGN